MASSSSSQPARRHNAGRESTDQDTSAPAAEGAASAQLGSDLDDLLDEIDDVLEVNAEEFVRSYVQKGGQ